MLKRNHLAIASIFLLMFTFGYSSPEKDEAGVVGSSDYDNLVSLFKEFRELDKPKVTNGVPDYTPAAMKEQRRGLKKFQKRLAAMDISGWPVSQKVEYYLVRAEMNGLDFYQRVLKPWERDPGF